MNTILAVALGGALGSVGRYLVVDGMARLAGPAFPWGTMTVNGVGGIAIGLLAGLFVAQPDLVEWRYFMVTGVLGGFTTFSAFSLDAVTLAQRGAWMDAALYVAGSLLVSLAGTLAGIWLVRAVAT